MKVVIVGAGILGASTAYHLAREGADVTIVDQALDGRATAAGAGIVCPWASGAEDPVFYRLYAGGARYYPELVDALAALGETDLGYRRSGALLVSDDAGRTVVHGGPAAAPAGRNAGDGAGRSCGRARRPALFPAAPAGAGGRSRHRRRAGGRAQACRCAAAGGAASWRGGPVRARRAGAPRRPGHRCATGRGECWRPTRSCVAAGAWAPALLRPLDIALPIEPQRGQIVHLHMPDTATESWPVILPPGSHYLVPFDNGRLVVGATRETGSGFDYRVTAAGQHEVLAEALRIAPGLGPATVIETRVGFRPVAPGIRPLLGQAPRDRWAGDRQWSRGSRADHRPVRRVAAGKPRSRAGHSRAILCRSTRCAVIPRTSASQRCVDAGG